MTNRKISKRDIAWSYLAQVMNLTVGIIILPVLFLYFNQEEIKIWIVFITLGSLGMLFEFGFQPTLTRNISYVLAGSKRVLDKGLAIDAKPSKDIDFNLFLDLIASGKSIYFRIAILLAFVFGPVSSFYLYMISETKMFWGSILFSWCLFALGLVVNFYFGYLTSMLHGAGEVANANKVTVVSRSAFVVISIALVISGYGILSIGFANLAASIIGRISARYWVRQINVYNRLVGMSRRPSENTVKIRRLVSANAYRLGATQFGSFAIQRGNILIAAALLPETEAAAYSLSVTVLMAIFGISLAVPQATIPFLGRAAQTEDRLQTRFLLGTSLIFAHTTFLLCFSIFATLVFYIDSSMMLNVAFINLEMLFILGLIVLLELNHSTFALFITASNHVPFYKASLISGALIIIFSVLTVETYGLWALIIIQGAIQAGYNNWKWPKMALHSQQTTFTNVLSCSLENLVSLKKVHRSD